MPIVETIAMVRRAYFLDGKSIKATCRELRLSRKVVRKVIRSGETSFSYRRAVQPRPKLGQWTATLDELLDANPAEPTREQLTLIRIFEPAFTTRRWRWRRSLSATTRSTIAAFCRCAAHYLVELVA